ncbi:MAG: acyltransferase [Chloroflexales bacterium]|nr:acyltransferase [Chloroflexales bacterium]
MILTSSHEIGPREHRAGEVMRAAVLIGDGAWLGPRSIILPGVTIGPGAIVTAGALVNKNVPPHTRVAGAPAKVVEELDPSMV